MLADLVRKALSAADQMTSDLQSCIRPINSAFDPDNDKAPVSYSAYNDAFKAARGALSDIEGRDLETWISDEFGGHGVAIRRKEEPAIPGEPLMSMEIAKDLARQAFERGAALSGLSLPVSQGEGGWQARALLAEEALQASRAETLAALERLRVVQTTPAAPDPFRPQWCPQCGVVPPDGHKGHCSESI